MPGSWDDSEIIHYWLDKIFFINIHINNNLKKILILDSASSHYDESLVDYLQKKILNIY